MLNPFVRIGAALPIAAIVVYGLFRLMGILIDPGPIELGEREFRTLDKITPQEDTQEVRRNQRAKPKKLASADKPPPPPKLSATKNSVNLPTPQIQGAAPTQVNFDRVQGLAFDAVVVSDRDAQPIRPPLPTYPRRAAERGIEGTCDVRFDVDVRGKPYNVVATCSDSIFEREAKRAVERVEFAPKIIRGKPAERRNVVYPIEFGLEQ